MPQRLAGPRAVLGTNGFGAYVARFAKFLGDKGLQPTVRNVSLLMYANEGRWVADCPQCRAGITCEKGWTDARCLGECGSIYPNVVWPTDFDDIEAELLVRPIPNQNWLLTETVDDLSQQNIAHGLPSPTRNRGGRG